MSTATPFGRVSLPNKAWLAKGGPEEILEPMLPIIDTHHHLWEQLPAALPQEPGEESSVYLLDEFAQDFNSGHNLIGTVYLQCHAKYRLDGPEERVRAWTPRDGRARRARRRPASGRARRLP